MHFQKPPLGTPLDWSNPLNDGCVLHLAMNEGHGDVVQDLSMNGNHGTLHNFAFPSTTVSGWNPGRTGVGLNFDGINDNVNIGHGASLNLISAITIMGRVRKGGAISSNLYIKKGAGADFDPVFLACKWNWGNRLIVQFADAINNREQFTSDAVRTTDDWCQVGVTWDGSDVIFYVDGVGENVGSTVLTSMYTTAEDGVVGYTGYTGGIDQFTLLNRAWTPKEVKDHAINPWQVYLDE